jgi:hypothetical protein
MGGGVFNSVAVSVDNVTCEINAGLLQIKDAGVSAAKLATGLLTEVLLEEKSIPANTLTPVVFNTGFDSTKYDEYVLRGVIKLTDTGGQAQVTFLRNNSVAAVYNHIQTKNNGTFVVWANQNSLLEWDVAAGASVNSWTAIELRINSKCDADNNCGYRVAASGLVSTYGGLATGYHAEAGDTTEIDIKLFGSANRKFNACTLRLYGVAK